MAEYTPETHSFSEAKAESVKTLDSIKDLLKKAIKGNIIEDQGKKNYDGYIDADKHIFALEKAIKELEYWIEEMPESDDDSESPRTKAEEIKKNIQTVKDTLESTIKLNDAFIDMSNNGAPFVEFKSVEEPEAVWTPTTDDMPYIELWGQTNSGGQAQLKDLNGTISLLGKSGKLDKDCENEFEKNECRFNLEMAVKNGDSYITKPVYGGTGTYFGNTVYLVVRGETVKDGDDNTIDKKYYNFSIKNQTVKIVKIDTRLMAHVDFEFVFPVGRNRTKYLEYPDNYFTIAKELPPYALEDIDTSDLENFYKEKGFWLYVVDHRNEAI
jgi:hypothetical protein